MNPSVLSAAALGGCQTGHNATFDGRAAPREEAVPSPREPRNPNPPGTRSVTASCAVHLGEQIRRAGKENTEFQWSRWVCRAVSVPNGQTSPKHWGKGGMCTKIL